MKNGYDFSGGERGKFFREHKVQKTLRLDADILDYFQTLSSRKHVPYQTLINNTRVILSFKYCPPFFPVDELRDIYYSRVGSFRADFKPFR
jgi:hypothetical protein